MLNVISPATITHVIWNITGLSDVAVCALTDVGIKAAQQNTNAASNILGDMLLKKQ